jgi:uncharacterized membrane protein
MVAYCTSLDGPQSLLIEAEGFDRQLSRFRKDMKVQAKHGPSPLKAPSAESLTVKMPVAMTRSAEGILCTLADRESVQIPQSVIKSIQECINSGTKHCEVVLSDQRFRYERLTTTGCGSLLVGTLHQDKIISDVVVIMIVEADFLKLATECTFPVTPSITVLSTIKSLITPKIPTAITICKDGVVYTLADKSVSVPQSVIESIQECIISDAKHCEVLLPKQSFAYQRLGHGGCGFLIVGTVNEGKTTDIVMITIDESDFLRLRTKNRPWNPVVGATNLQEIQVNILGHINELISPKTTN